MSPGWLTLDPLAPWPFVVVPGVLLLAVLVGAAVRRRSARRRPTLLAGMVVVTVLAALGPHVGGERTAYRERPETQVVVALDRTASMAVRDLDGRSRWEQAVQDLTELTQTLPTTFALVTWGDGARLDVPPTTDVASFVSSLEAMATEPPVAGLGSRLDQPRRTLARVLRTTAVRHPDRALYLLLLGDGENTASGDQRSYAALSELLSGGLVIGYGTEAGGPIPLDPERPEEVVPDADGTGAAVSRRGRANLRRVAGELGVGYRGREELTSAQDVAAALEPALRTVDGPSRPRDVTWLLGLVLLLLAAVELRATSGAVREIRSLRRTW